MSTSLLILFIQFLLLLIINIFVLFSVAVCGEISTFLGKFEFFFDSLGILGILWNFYGNFYFWGKILWKWLYSDIFEVFLVFFVKLHCHVEFLYDKLYFIDFIYRKIDTY